MSADQSPVSSIDYQQRRGAGWDAVDEAIQTYDQWMLDDDNYDPLPVLRTIIERLRYRRGESASLRNVSGGTK